MIEISKTYKRAARKRGPRMGVMQENLEAIDAADAAGFYLMGFLLQHATIEANLRASVGRHQPKVKFSQLIQAVHTDPKKFKGKAALVRDLCALNSFRNRLIHELWSDGHGRANAEAKRGAAWALGVTRRALNMPTVRDLPGTPTTLMDLEGMDARLLYDPRRRPRRNILGGLLADWIHGRKEGYPTKYLDALKVQIEKSLRVDRLELRYITHGPVQAWSGPGPTGQAITICQIFLRPVAPR